jgi:hypothetical protein
MPSLSSFAAALALVFLLPGGPASSAELSRSDWSNPAQAGSVLWIKNRWTRAITLDSLYVRTLGFRGFEEVAFNAGPRRLYFTVRGNPCGHWARLVPRDRRRLRVRARDSLMITGFECGAHLRAKPGAKQAAEEFVLDLKLVDGRGKRSQVKISQLTPTYPIRENPEVVGKDPAGE